MVRFRQRTDLPDGDALLVAPLHVDWVPAAAELLASSFADSLAASLYKRYLQRQIKAYLEAHINLPPKAVVLAALRMPRELAEAAEAEAWAELEQPAGPAALASWPSSSASSMSTGNQGVALSSNSNSSSSGSSSSGSGPALAPGPLPTVQLGDNGSAAAQLGGLDSALTSCDEDLAAASPSFELRGSSAGAAGRSSSSGSEEAAAASSGPVAVASAAGALTTVGSGSLLAPGSGAVLTSVLELSFSPSTRSKHVTLQSPDVSICCCCYWQLWGWQAALVIQASCSGQMLGSPITHCSCACTRLCSRGHTSATWRLRRPTAGAATA